MTVGQMLIARARRVGLSQYALADRLPIARRTVEYWAQGRKPRLYAALRADRILKHLERKLRQASHAD